MTTSSVSHSPFTYSSRRNPCPVCGRTKDSDCRWDGELLHCRTYAKIHLTRGEVIRGHDGQDWAYLGDSDGGRWAMFRPHQERRYDREPKPKPTPSAKQSSKPTVTPPTAKKTPRPKGEQNYVYHDVDGKPVILVRRTDYGAGEKSFSQLRYENGKWVAGLNEQVTQRVRLYRIAEARELSKQTGHPIFLVEGENCAERLLRVGIPATTSIGGAGKWSKYGGPNYLQDLSNLRVILCPDADQVGLDHMLEVEKSLRAHGIEIAGWLLAPPDAPWENLPDGGGLDVVDWLENGATAEDILSSVRESLPEYLVVEDETQDGDLAEEENSTRNGKKKSAATILIELAQKSGTLWHDSTGAGWVDYIEKGSLKTARIRSKQFRNFLSRVFWKREHRSYSSEAWSEASSFLEALAGDGPQRDAFLRVARHENCIYIDLGTDDWRIVRVSPNGWDIIPYSESPVRFYRADCQLALPIPTRDGSLDDLWQLLNVREDDRPLVLGWILGCLTPDGAKPILALSGEKGSGKSSAAVLLKRLTDPTRVSKGGEIGHPRDVAAAAAGRWVLVFDNLSHLSTDQQNLLCRIVTGEGFTHRALYTDLEEVFFEYHRPQILTSIDLVPTRSDLLDRCLIVRLERISEESRLTEEELEALTTQLLPGIYGGLLDLLATALRNLPTTKPAGLPRMASFAQLCIAAGLPGFVEAYSSNIQVGNQAAVEANPIAAGILSLLDTCGGYWQGTSTELIQELQKLDPTSREYQKLSARSVGKKLATSLRGDLRAVGVEVDQGKGNKGQRYLILSRVSEPQKTMPQSPPVSTPSLDEEEEQPIPTPQTPAPAQNSGATAVPSTPSFTSAPARPEVSTRPEVAALQPNNNNNNSRLQSTTNGTMTTSKAESKSFRPLSEEWRGLLDACCRTQVPPERLRETLSAATGIPKEGVCEAPLTRERYQRALRYLAHNGIPPWDWET